MSDEYNHACNALHRFVDSMGMPDDMASDVCFSVALAALERVLGDPALIPVQMRMVADEIDAAVLKRRSIQ